MNRITRVWYQIQHIDSAGITFSQGQILLEQKYAASTESRAAARDSRITYLNYRNLSRILNVCLCCCQTCDRHAER